MCNSQCYADIDVQQEATLILPPKRIRQDFDEVLENDYSTAKGLVPWELLNR